MIEIEKVAKKLGVTWKVGKGKAEATYKNIDVVSEVIEGNEIKTTVKGLGPVIESVLTPKEDYFDLLITTSPPVSVPFATQIKISPEEVKWPLGISQMLLCLVITTIVWLVLVIWWNIILFPFGLLLLPLALLILFLVHLYCLYLLFL